MRIEKPANGLYQAKLAQDQIEVVSSDLVSSTGALNSQITIVNNNLIAASSTLDSKIDSSLSKLRVRSLNSLNMAQFFTTSLTPVSVTGSNTIFNKKYSDTELRVAVFLTANTSSSIYYIEYCDITYSVNGGSTWLGSTRLRGSNYHAPYEMLPYVIYYNLGVLPSGNVDFRIGLNRISSVGTVYLSSFSYQFIEAMENA